MKGGVILFRESGVDARRYSESDRSRADGYYLESRTALAEFTAVNVRGSPRFAEMVVNVPMPLSIAAALRPEVSELGSEAG